MNKTKRRQPKIMATVTRHNYCSSLISESPKFLNTLTHDSSNESFERAIGDHVYSLIRKNEFDVLELHINDQRKSK